MKTDSNWPGGFDLSHPNWTAKTPSRSTWKESEGVGGWAKDSHDIPVVDAILYVGGTAIAIWAMLGLARWIWG